MSAELDLRNHPKLLGLRKLVYYVDRLNGGLQLIRELGIPIGKVNRTAPDQMIVALDDRLIEINFRDVSPEGADLGAYVHDPQVRAYDPGIGSMVALCHNQTGIPLIHNGGTSELATANQSPVCALKIMMEPGAVAMPHTHNWAHVYVSADSTCGPVVTLYGDDYSKHVWLVPGGELLIEPGVKHAAVAPLAHSLTAELFDGMYRHTHGNPVLVTEHRTTGHHAEDIYNHVEDIGLVLDRIKHLGLKVDPHKVPVDDTCAT